MSSDVVTLPSGQVITKGLARARGLLDENGELLSTVPADSVAAAALEADRRRAAWNESQGIDRELAAIAAEKERVRIALGGAPVIAADGTPKAAKAPKIARPRNVTKTGEEVTDEETLAKIAADAAALEAAKAAE